MADVVISEIVTGVGQDLGAGPFGTLCSNLVTGIGLTDGNVLRAAGLPPLVSGAGSAVGQPVRIAVITGVVSGTGLTLGVGYNPLPPDNVVSGDGFTLGNIRKGARISAIVSGSGSTLGTVGRSALLPNVVSGAGSTLGSVRAHNIRLFGPVVGVGSTVGTIRSTHATYSTPEDIRLTLGFRPPTSLLVYANGVLTPTDITNAFVPDGGSFILSPLFFSDTSPTLYNVGARSNYVGTRVGAGYNFRPPARKEIVWQIQTDAIGRTAPGEFLIYDGTVWGVIQPFAYKGILAQLQYVADQLDPVGALRYYGQLLGALGAQMGQDNLDLASMGDPDATPARYLSTIADEFSVDISDTDQVDERRRRVKAGVSIQRAKGEERSAVAAIREAGYVGYLRELWVNPNAAGNWSDPAYAPASARATLTNAGVLQDVRANSGLKGTDLIERPHNYANDDTGPTYFPSSRVSVHINNLDGTPVHSASADDIDRLYQRLRYFCLPGHVDIRQFVTDVGTDDTAVVVGDSVTVTEIDDGGDDGGGGGGDPTGESPNMISVDGSGDSLQMTKTSDTSYALLPTASQIVFSDGAWVLTYDDGRGHALTYVGDSSVLGDYTYSEKNFPEAIGVYFPYFTDVMTATELL